MATRGGFYETLKEAGIEINLPSRRAPTFRDYKSRILEYFNSSNLQQNLRDQEFIDKFPHLAGFEQAQGWTAQSIREKLSTDGEFANEVIIQLAALALGTKITVESTSTPGKILGIFEGNILPHQTCQQLHILLREDRACPIFYASLEPVLMSDGSPAMSDGHFWLVLDVDPSPGNDNRSELDRPQLIKQHQALLARVARV